MKINLEQSWKKKLGPEFEKEYMQELCHFIDEELAEGKIIYPPQEDIFTAFNHTPFKKVKVVIIGQDPYHGPEQAHGLSFSVKSGVKIPPSLRNIYKELHEDLGIPIPKEGYLLPWADQGVLMLNAVLTVEQSKAGSHHKKGWEKFTDKVIEVLNEEKDNLVFILWGSPAQKKGSRVDRNRHLVLKAVHPSPLSAYRGFFGCRHFSKANEYLIEHNQDPIDWEISN